MQQLPAVQAGAGYAGADADTQAQVDALAFVEAGVAGQVDTELFRQIVGAGKVGVVQYGDKLLAAEARKQVTATQALLHALGRVMQAGVAGQMAVPVIDLFEVIQVHHEQGNGVLAALRPCQGAIQLFAQGLSVE
ncbi:hypothetical protein D9M68_843460 [compost metagenome]